MDDDGATFRLVCPPREAQSEPPTERERLEALAQRACEIAMKLDEVLCRIDMLAQRVLVTCERVDMRVARLLREVAP